MNKALSISLCTIPLVVTAIIGLVFFLSFAGAQGGGIIVGDADSVWTNAIEYSANLADVMKNVTPRVIMEYGDLNSRLNLDRSVELGQVASIVSSRVAVEYADFVATSGLQESEDLAQEASAATPRIVVEYADFIFRTDLGPKPMEDNTPPIIHNVYQQPANDNVRPDDKVVVYTNVTDDISGVKQVILNYTTNNGTWFNLEMMHLESTIYNATIPEFPYCTNVTYVVIAEDNANHTITTEDMGYECQYHVIPEFSIFMIVPIFVMATLIAGIMYRMRARNQQLNRMHACTTRQRSRVKALLVYSKSQLWC